MVPQTPGLVALLPNLYNSANATLNAAILSRPDIVRAFLQNNPMADTAIERLFSELVAFRKSPRENITWQNLYVDNQFQNLHVLAHGAGLAGATVNITLNPASHLTGSGTALAFESYEYVGYSSITGQMFNGFVENAGITRTSGAWVLAMRPTDETAGIIPAQALGDPLRLLQPVTREGNTVHNKSGRLTNVYSETKHMQIMEREQIQITDLAAFSDMTYTESRNSFDGRGDITSGMWTHREISLGMKQWHQSDMWGRLHNSGEMLVTDTRGRYSTEGLWHWIENAGGNLFTFTGTVTNADVQSWNDTLHDNYEDVSEYVIMCGQVVYNAIMDWIGGGHINGQHIVLEQSTMFLDFQKFTWRGITYNIPKQNFSEFNNQFGHAEFNFRSKALFIPVGKTTTENSVGQPVPFMEWVFLSNNNALFDGVEGADQMWWVLGPEFISRYNASPGNVVIATEDGTASVGGKRIEGSNFKKAQVFAILQP
jgi:hypothetical protein